MAYRYRDVNEIKNQILLQVKQQNADIKALLQTSHSPMRSSAAFDVTDAAAAVGSQHAELDAGTTTGYSSLGEISDTDGSMAVSNVAHYRQTSGSVARPGPVNKQRTEPANHVDSQPAVSVSIQQQDDPVRVSSASVRRRRTAASHADLSSSRHTSPASTSNVSRYNWRSRLSSPTESASTAMPATDLGAEVNRLAGISARNRVKVLRVILNRVSSDED